MKLYKKTISVAAVIFITVSTVFSQDSESSMFFSNKILSNPAFTGSSGTSNIEISYRDYYPGYNFQLGSVYGSFDRFVEVLHGGMGLYVMEKSLGGILNDLRAGVTYAYHLRAGRDLYINAGFMATVIHRSFNSDRVILPDQIDPLLGPVLVSQQVLDLRSGTHFDTGVGFLINYKNITGGFSLNHIARPDITGRGGDGSRIARRFSFHGSANLSLPWEGFSLDPITDLSLQGGFLGGSVGTVIGYKALNVNIIPYFDSRSGLCSIQTGLYVEKGSVGFGYNHHFSPPGSTITLPVNYSSQVTVRIGLNNVEKRDVIRAINYPKL